MVTAETTLFPRSLLQPDTIDLMAIPSSSIPRAPGPEVIPPFVHKAIQAQIRTGDGRSFFVGNATAAVEKLRQWDAHLGGVQPFYAVKCNDNPDFLRFLARAGLSFDCASAAEIKQVLPLVGSDRIIFAHPQKTEADILYARDKGVDKLVFDSEDEMRKIAGIFPSARLFLRLHAEDPTSLVRLSDKFGAHAPEAQSLLRLATTLGLQVVGLCFHVGSAASDPAAYTRAIKTCRTMYDYNQRLERSHPISVMDIGGGFTAANFEAVSRAVSAAIRSEFGNIESVRWMAEPGRFFANEVFSLVCRVIGVGRRPGDIFVNDGIYQNFLNAIIEQSTPAPILLNSLEPPRDGRPEGQPHTIWGQTCCGQDKINSLCLLPRAACRGDHLYYPNVGAYSHVTASGFNGQPRRTDTVWTTNSLSEKEILTLTGVGQGRSRLLSSTPRESQLMQAKNAIISKL